MRLKYIISIALIVCCFPLLLYFSLAHKLMQRHSVTPETKSNAPIKEEIKVVPLNPNLIPPMISNPLNAQSNLQSPVVVKQIHKQDTKKTHLRSEFKKDDISYNVHAFYYPWYASKDVNGEWSHWNHQTIPHWLPSINAGYPTKTHVPPEDIAARFYPSLGPYSSSDSKVIHEHMKQLRTAGVGVIAVSWYPPQTKDPNAILFVDDLMPLLLNIAQIYSIQVCFHIEPYVDRSAITVKRDIQYIIDTYGNYSAFYRYQNLPLIYIYDSYIIPGDEWATIFQPSGEHTIRGTAYDIIAIGLFVERNHCTELHVGGFNGFYTYFAAQGFVYGSTLANWKTMKQCARSLQSPQLFIPSVGPGYDDLPVRPWNEKNTHSRENGEYYKQMWREAIQIESTLISITSFNEWHEGSQIEKAVEKEGYEDYGEDPELYLHLTREMIAQM